MAFIRAVSGILFVAVITALCVLNMNEVELTLSPLHPSVKTPFYVVILGCSGFGFLLGAAMVWANGLRTRWTQRRTIKALEKERDALNEALESGALPSDIEVDALIRDES